MSAPRGRTYLIQIDVIAQEFVTILESGSLVLEDAVTGDYVTVAPKDLDAFAESDPPYTAHVASCVRRELLDDTHDRCGWEWTQHPERKWWYRVGACPKCHPPSPAPAHLSLAEDRMLNNEPVDHDAYRRSWVCGAHHVRSRPWLTISWVTYPHQTPHLVVHDGPTGPALHFDNPDGATFVSPEGITPVSWDEAFAPNGDWSTIWGPVDSREALTPKGAAYHALAVLVGLGKDWLVRPARFVGDDDDPLSVTSIERRFGTAQQSMFEYLALLEAQYDEGVATNRPEYWHEPMWVGLKHGQPLVLVDESGVLHTSSGQMSLPNTIATVEQLVSNAVAPRLPKPAGPGRLRTTERPADVPATATKRVPQVAAPGDGEVSLPTWVSKVRGLMLGIALGDSISSGGGFRDNGSQLRAGAATELAAWTVEGLLRNFTAYNWAIQSQNEEVMRAYQRWALLRGARSKEPGWEPLPIVDGRPARGWLMDTPEIRTAHGSSPSMMMVSTTGISTREPSSRGLIKGLPYAALAGASDFIRGGPDKVAAYAGMFASQTHSHPLVTGSATSSTFLITHLLRSNAPLTSTLHHASRSADSIWGLTSTSDFPRAAIGDAIDRGSRAPRRHSNLTQLARDGDALGAFLGGIYVATSFDGNDGAEGILDFCSPAANGRSVASVALALAGATHGYESLPPSLISRLEFGWIMDRLAIDLTTRVSAPKWQPIDDRAWRLKYPATPRNEE